jgi:hypothetical protein
VWTEADLESLGWHDNAVHAVAVEPALPCPGRLLIDLDYIVDWVHPTAPAGPFSFWVCPATLAAVSAVDQNRTASETPPEPDRRPELRGASV